jgi:Spy/CpxP family protein refolding chaperone
MVNRTRLKAYAIVAGVFVLGALAGAGASHAFAQRDYASLVAGERDFIEHRKLRALSRELDLSSEQRERIAEILRKHRDDRRGLSRQMFERCGEPVRAHKAKVSAEIRAVLDPAQQTRFDQFEKQQQERGPWGHPAGSPRR